MTRAFASLLVTLSLFLATLTADAQHLRPQLPPASPGPYATGHAQRSAAQHTALAAFVDNAAVTTRWASKVARIGARQHGLPEVNAIKDAKLATKWTGNARPHGAPQGAPKAVTPEIGVAFEANWSSQQTPPDNSMAISNGGWIVTCNNDGILYYSSAGTYSFGAFWSDFFSGQGLNANIYDPKVLYDSQADRFFMVVLHGSTAADSKLLLCFSQTNDPNDGWWIYQLPGNVMQNNTWFDYPSIGVSNNEVYVSGNLFTSGNNQFNQAILFQVQKAQGYAGNNLNWQYWFGLDSDIGGFTVTPASWGQSGNYGPGILLVSSAAGGDNRYVLWDLTDDMTGNPALNTYTVTVPAYSPAADAQMPGNADLLDNGDCRLLGAFYLNNTVHCVHHKDVGSGWNGIAYTRININNLSATQQTFGTPGVADISYPQFASYATTTSDPSVMIAHLRSSTSVYPEVRVVNCDAGMNWSSGVQVKAGETYVDFIQGEDRWGDYTGMARKHNATEPEVWLAGCYGANISGVLNNTWKTWVAQIGGSSTAVAETSTAPAAQVFPSPAVDLFTVVFQVRDREEHVIEVLDALGAVVKQLHRAVLNPGEYRASFNRGQLAPGQYLISIRTPNTRIAHEKLVVQ